MVIKTAGYVSAFSTYTSTFSAVVSTMMDKLNLII
jgi:hypothetical protein